MRACTKSVIIVDNEQCKRNVNEGTSEATTNDEPQNYDNNNKRIRHSWIAQKEQLHYLSV